MGHNPEISSGTFAALSVWTCPVPILLLGGRKRDSEAGIELGLGRCCLRRLGDNGDLDRIEMAAAGLQVQASLPLDRSAAAADLHAPPEAVGS